MSHLNIEIKARCGKPDKIREILLQHNARFVGVDHQTDTYFNVPAGRLKLRQGNIEKSLIFYNRHDQAGPKQADVWLYPAPDGKALKDLLAAALGVRIEVIKCREIYFIDNVKFHIDRVEGLGCFIEIEAIDADGSIGKETLQRQCQTYLALLDIRPDDLIEDSYSDRAGSSS